MDNIIDFTGKMPDIQGLKVIHTYVNNIMFTVCAVPSRISGIYPKCGSTAETVHDERFRTIFIYLCSMRKKYHLKGEPGKM